MQWPWNKAEPDLDREVQHHLEALADAYERQGLSRQEALRQARAEFGGVDKAKEECRDIRWWSWLAQVQQDVRFGWRMMLKTPAITVAAVASLALGIGATTSILSLADALLWRTLPVPHAERLGEVLWESRADPEGLVISSSGEAYREGPLRVANYFSKASFEAMQTRAEGKAQVAGYIYPSRASASFNGGVVTASVRGVTGNFFPMLGLQPYAGRLFGNEDTAAGAASVDCARRLSRWPFWVRCGKRWSGWIARSRRSMFIRWNSRSRAPCSGSACSPGCAAASECSPWSCASSAFTG